MKKLLLFISKIALIFLSILLLILLVLFFFRNKIGTYLIEDNASKKLKTKVEIENLYISPNKLNISWDNFVIADKKDPWKNTIETGKCTVEFEFWPLTAKKLVINNLSVENLKYGTKRETSGKSKYSNDIVNTPSMFDQIKTRLKKEKENIPVFNPDILKDSFSLQNIEKTLDLTSISKFQQAKSDLEKTYNYWEEKIQNNDYQKKLTVLNQKFNSLKKSEKTKIELAAEYITLYDDYKKLLDEVELEKKQLENDLKNAKNLKITLEESLNDDYKKIESTINSPDTAIQNLAYLLIGDQATQYSLVLLENIENIRTMNNTENLQTESTINNGGKYANYPTFWIKNTAIKTTFNDKYIFDGKILNISSDQKLTKQPIEFNLNTSKNSNLKIDLSGIFDYTGKTMKEHIVLKGEDINIENITLKKFNFLPTGITKSNLNFDAIFISKDNTIDLNSNFTLNDIEFFMKNINHFDKNFYNIVQSITKKTNTLNFNFHLMQSNDNFNINLDSNINDLVKTELKSLLNQKIDLQKNKLKKELNLKITPLKKDIELLLNNKLTPLFQNLKTLGIDVNENMLKTKSFESNYEKKINEKLDNILDKIEF